MTEEKHTGKQLLLVQSQRTKIMLDLCQVVRQTGECVLKMEARAIHDTTSEHGHQFSTADDVASSALREAIDVVMPYFTGDIVEEAEGRRATNKKLTFPVMVCDALEGSTNTKRLSSLLAAILKNRYTTRLIIIGVAQGGGKR